MLLQEFKKIIEIDDHISKMHEELINLYGERSALLRAGESLDGTPEDMEQANVFTAEVWAEMEYQKLTKRWREYKIKVPPFSKLEKKLITAHGIIKDLNQVRPEVENKMILLLVPPTKLLGFPLKMSLRNSQSRIPKENYVHPDIVLPPKGRKWRVLLVYAEATGLYLGTAQKILEDKAYYFMNFDARALGIFEYEALALQCGKPIDYETATLLFRDYKSEEFIISASSKNNKFNFNLEDAGRIFGDLRFRPAIELT